MNRLCLGKLAELFTFSFVTANLNIMTIQLDAHAHAHAHEHTWPANYKKTYSYFDSNGN